MTFRPADKLQPLKPLAEYEQKVVRMRQRGFIYPLRNHQNAHARAGTHPSGISRRAISSSTISTPKDVWSPVDRPYGQNKANIIAGVIRNFTAKYPEGMTRVLLLGDPSKDLGALAEPECRRILAALDLAQDNGRSRWNGSRSRPAPRSRWTAAWRTWIGLPASCAA